MFHCPGVFISWDIQQKVFVFDNGTLAHFIASENLRNFYSLTFLMFVDK